MLYDRVYFATATTGTGTITAGAAETGFRTMAGASIPDGTTIEYAITDGAAWETGTGVVGGTSTTMTRVLSDSSTTALLNLSGSAKVFITPIAARMEQFVTLPSDVSNSTVTMAAATGLSFTATANKNYFVQVNGASQSAAAGTGMAVALDIPSGSVIGQLITSLSATQIGGTEQVADNATTGATTAVRAANTNAPFVFWAIVNVGGSGGTVQVQFRSEVAASAVTLKANLTAMNYREI